MGSILPDSGGWRRVGSWACGVKFFGTLATMPNDGETLALAALPAAFVSWSSLGNPGSDRRRRRIARELGRRSSRVIDALAVDAGECVAR
jgi:hypothetical protein